jgi:hypothetical protein
MRTDPQDTPTSGPAREPDPTAEPSSQTNIKINFVGDLCLSRIDPTTFRIDDSLLKLFSTADLNVANLECVLTRSDSMAPHRPFHLKSQPRENPILDLMHVFSLANNHIMDFGVGGLKDTIRFLDSCHKGHFGAGLTEVESLAPLSIEIRGKTITFIGFARWNSAAGTHPGTAPAERQRLASLTAKAKRAGHFVVLFPHWNYEYIYYPAPDSRKLAKCLLAAGADLIVGSHPHVIQGYEQHGGKYVFHSLGNFVFSGDEFKDMDLGPYAEAPVLNESFILSIEVGRDDDYDFHLTPIVTSDNGIHPLTSSARERFLAKLASISSVLLDDAVHTEIFYRQAAQIFRTSSGTLRNVASRQGLLSMMVLLAGVTRQDLKILMHGLLQRARLALPIRHRPAT